MVNNSVSPWQN